MLVSLEQATANALARWLQQALGSDVVVETRWPEPDVTLPPKIITILLAGPPEEEPLDPIVVGRVDTSPERALFEWRLRALRQPLQLDVWTRYDVERDDLRQRLRPALNAGMGATIGAFNAMPVRHGVVVPLADGWTGYADCFFERAHAFDASDSARRSEYRLTLRGWADVDLTEVAESARLVTIRIEQRITSARQMSLHSVGV